MKLVFEMETSDPDDFLTLCWLADHPTIDLVGVVVTPGSRAQMCVVRWALNACNRPEVPIGAFKTDHLKECVSGWHYDVYGDVLKDTNPGEVYYGPSLLGSLFMKHPEAVMLTGAPPKNLGTAHRLYGELRIVRWVCQGGFAGDPVALPSQRLEKFKGLEVCATFNLNGAPELALELIASTHIRQTQFVSKNVCHNCHWTPAVAAAIHAHNPTPRPGLALMMKGADAYLEKHPEGKAIHDLLAAAVAYDESVCDFRGVELYRQGGKWGSRLKPGSRQHITVDYHLEKLIRVIAR